MMNRQDRRKIDRYIRKRDRDALRALNRGEGELYEGTARVLKDLLLILVGVGAGMYISTFRANAYTGTASIPPRCEYVGVIPEAEAPGQPPEAIDGTQAATPPEAVKVEAVGERWESMGRWMLTAYCPLECCNGSGRAWKTASGEKMIVGDTVAIGGLPFGTRVKIRDHVYTVTDRGVSGKHVDILHSSHRAADDFGIQYAEVFIKKGE